MKNHSGVHKFFGAAKKSKKGKVRSLSSVGKALSSCKMGCNVSETEREEKAHEPPPSSSSASVIAKNFLNGCNGIHNASVPRKLRSAMKKRSHESMLLGSEKVNHKMNGIIESPKKDVHGHITKDEEEVAETLYAMAAMFPENGMNGDIKELDRLSFTEKNTVLEDLKDSNVNTTFQALGTAQHASHSCPEKSAREATKFSSTHETISQEKLELSERVEFVMGSHSNKGSSHHHPELCLVMGLNVPRQLQISHIERKPHVEFEMGKNVDCKQEQHMLKVQKENEEGLALWPGLSPVASTSHAHVKSLATKAPDGLEAAISASKHDLMESCYSSGKIHEVVNHKRPWKRCATHVHISHIIHNLEFPKRRVIENEFQKMRTHEGSKLGVLMEVPKMNVIRSGVTSTHGSGQFIATVKNLHESKNYILQKQCHYGPQNQNFNFLSLSSGSNGLKVGNSYDKIGTRLETLSKLQVPYFQPSFTQHDHGLMSVPTPQSQYSSTSYLDHLSVPGPQIRQHPPQYYGNPSCGTHHNNSTVINKQQQQSFWTVQLQGRCDMNSNIMKTSFPSWKNGRHDYVTSPCAQGIGPRSHASSISVQQQQLIASIQEKWGRPSSSFCM